MAIAHKLLRTLLAITFAVAAAGCWSGPTRYYHVINSFEIDGKPVTLDSNYHCEDHLTGPNFGPGGLLTSQTSPYGYLRWLVFPLEDGSAVLLRGHQSCRPGESVGGVYWLDSAINPTRLEEFQYQRTVGTRHTIASIRTYADEVANAIPDSRQPPEQQRVWKLAFDEKRQFQRVTAIVAPESSVPDDRRESVASLSGVILAPAHPNGRNLFLPAPLESRPIIDQYDYRAPRLPFVFDGAQWVQADLPAAEAARISRVLPLDTPGTFGGFARHPTTVRYRDKVFTLTWQQEVFDADSRLFILFSNETSWGP